MSKLVTALLLGLSLITLPACQQDSAKSKTDDFNALVQSLQNDGVPSSSWSYDKLQQYEDKVDRAQQIYDELKDQPGVVFIGNPEGLRTAREICEAARSEKISAQPRTGTN